MTGPQPNTKRCVEVAVDAAGVPGGRTYTYHVPAEWADVDVGTAVLVEYGRRPAVGIVLDIVPPPELETKPLLDVIGGGGAILTALQARLARHVAVHYLAPPAVVVRAMLPVDLLERIRLVVRAAPAAIECEVSGIAPETLAAIRAAGEAGVAVDELSEGRTRAALVRRLRRLELDGGVVLEWRLGPMGARPRSERTASLTEAGVAALARLSRADPIDGRPLGPRQQAALLELGKEPGAEHAAAELAGRHGASALTGLARRGLLTLGVRVRERRPVDGLGAAARGATERAALPAGSDLRVEQARVVARVQELIRERRHAGLLLEGAAASGKTAVYAAAVAAALAAGRTALILVPEVALAVPLLDRLRHDLGVDAAVVHSALSQGERADEWRRIRSGEARVVVGTRLAVLAPMDDPGLIVVDEEHDPAYKSDRTPRYQARDLALVLGRLSGAPVILGSATPSVVSVGRARSGELEYQALGEPRAGAGASVQVVDLRQELAEGNRGLLSGRLTAALAALDRAAGERAILVINRRGSASIVLCRDCGYVQVCPECHRPLVFHAATMALRCHHCGATAPVARRCPACGSARIRYLGGGTERVEREVGLRLPGLRIGRLDRDVVERRGAAVKVVDDFADGRLDVLVGTSLVTKGLDVPEVTLVGVVSADIALNLPDERAAERTYQLLAQAVGRAGRGARRGLALLQTYQPEHPAITAVASGDPRPFVEAELRSRQSFGSPPFGSLIKLTVALEDRPAAEAEARRFSSLLRERASLLAVNGERPAHILGPVPAYIAKRQGRWRFHVVIRGLTPRAVLETDPGLPWSIDVDPESLL